MVNPHHLPLVIGLDLGTTNCKAVALSARGEIVAHAQREYPLHTSHSGWVAQDATEVWQGVIETLHDLHQQTPSEQIVGLSSSGAMHSLLPVSADGAPLALAMTWADQRAMPQAHALRSQANHHALYERTGCPLQAIYHPAKLRWWQEEAPQIARQATHFVALKDWVLYQLSGRWATDFSLASTTGLLDIHNLRWDEEALALAGISADRLPPLVSPLTVFGKITRSGRALPFEGLPLVAGASDGGLANLGAGAQTAGQSVITVGTSGAVRRIVDQPWLDPHERTWCYVLSEGRWFAGGAINNAGLALQWVRERFYPDLSAEAGFSQLLADAASAPAGAQGVMLLPYFTGERSPYWDTAARAALLGLRLEHSRAHVARATLEGVAFCLADVWQALAGSQDNGQPTRLTGSITHAPVWAQIVADVLGVELIALEAADASAVGAAMLGHQALGSSDLETLASHTLPASRYIPDGERHARYAERHQLFRQLYRFFEFDGSDRRQDHQPRVY